MDTSGFETLHVSAEQDGKVLVLEFDHGKANEMGTAQLTEIVLEEPGGAAFVVELRPQIVEYGGFK